MEALTAGLGKEAARSSGKGLPQAHPDSPVEQQEEQCDWSRNRRRRGGEEGERVGRRGEERKWGRRDS